MTEIENTTKNSFSDTDIFDCNVNGKTNGADNIESEKEIKIESFSFHDDVEFMFEDILIKYPSFVEDCEKYLYKKKDSPEKLKSCFQNYYGQSFNLSIFEECWKIADDKNDGSIMVKFAITCIYNYLQKIKINSSEKDIKKDIRSFILLKKRDLKKDIVSNKYLQVIPDATRDWVNDNNELILTECYCIFDYLSFKRQILYVLKSLEYILCDLDLEDSLNSPLGVLSYPLNKTQTAYPMVEREKEFYQFFYIFVDPTNPNHILKIIVGKQFFDNSLDVDKSSNTVIISDKNKAMMDAFKKAALTRDDGEIGTLIYNLNNYYFNKMGYIDFHVDDIVEELLKKNKFKDKNSYSLKYELRNKVYESVNKLLGTRVEEYFLNEKGKKSLPPLSASFIFTEGRWLNEEERLARLFLSYRARTAFAQKLHRKILKKDYYNIENDTARRILFFLQDARIQSASYGYKGEIPFSSFKNEFQLDVPDKVLVRMLVKALDELKEKEILISSYKRFMQDQKFDFEFIPLSDKEKAEYSMDQGSN